MPSARTIANALAASAVAGAAVLYRFPPQENSFYPRCPFFALTNHLCPGCGTTRALAALLHGHFVTALHYNAAFVFLLPVLLFYFGKMYWTAIDENRLNWPQVSNRSLRVAISCVLLFSLVRDFSQHLF